MAGYGQASYGELSAQLNGSYGSDGVAGSGELQQGNASCSGAFSASAGDDSYTMASAGECDGGPSAPEWGVRGGTGSPPAKFRFASNSNLFCFE